MREVKFLDLKAQYPLIKDEILYSFSDIIDSTCFISGKYVSSFEKAFANYCDVEYCVVVNNGTSALYLALLALGIGHDDEVILPVNTFIATAEAISMVGAKPVFVDIDENTYNLDTSLLAKKINKNTKAIIPVHLHGQCAEMDDVLRIANANNLLVLEDSCQAHGASYKGKKAGSMSVCGAFSFYPGKNLGTWGEGGAVVTNNIALAEKMKLIRDHGSRKKYHHEIIGTNLRMNELQAAVLNTKIRYLDQWNSLRRKNAELYMYLLKDCKNIVLPHTEIYNEHVWHLFVIRVPNRDLFMDYMKKNLISCAIHYPFPLHLTEAYSELGHIEGDFPLAERLSKEIVSLPMYPELTEEDIEHVSGLILNFFK